MSGHLPKNEERSELLLPALIDELVEEGRMDPALQRRLLLHRLLHVFASWCRRRLPGHDGAILWFFAVALGVVALGLFESSLPWIPIAMGFALLGAHLFASAVDGLLPRQLRIPLGKGFLCWRRGHGESGDLHGAWRILLCDERDGRLVLAWRDAAGAEGRRRMSVRSIEELQVLPSTDEAFTGNPPRHRLVARSEGEAVVLADGADMDRLLPLASFLGQKLGKRLVDRTSDRPLLFEPEELARPTYLSLASVLNRGEVAWEPTEGEGSSASIPLAGRADRARSFEVRALHFVLARCLPALSALLSTVAFTVMVAGVGSSAWPAMLFAFFLLSTVGGAALGSMLPLRTQLHVGRDELEVSEHWLFLHRDLCRIPWKRLLRIVAGAGTLTLLDGEREQRLSVEDAVEGQRRIEAVLLERHGVFSPGNLFRRLRDLSEARALPSASPTPLLPGPSNPSKEPGRARILGVLRGRRLVLTVEPRSRPEDFALQDAMRAAPDPLALWAEAQRRDRAWLAWRDEIRDSVQRSRHLLGQGVPKTMARKAMSDVETQLHGAPSPMESTEEESWAAQIVLHGTRLRNGRSFELMLAPPGWSGLLEEGGWQSSALRCCHVRGDGKALLAVLEERTASLHRALRALASDLPGSRFRVDANRVLWSHGGLGLPTRTMAELVDAMEALLLLARGEEHGEALPPGDDLMSLRLEQANESRCNLCGETLDRDEARLCPRCETPHHPECWNWNGGCTVYACPERPPSDGERGARPQID